MPIAQTEPGALSRTVRRMYSVEPLSSAAWTTSQVHSGWTMTRMPGCCLRTFSICFTVKRVWTEQWPFQSSRRARSSRLRIEAAHDLVRIPDRHLVERHAHGVGGVAAEVLIGQEQDALAARPRPFERRAGVAGGADRAAVLADERFDAGGGVDVGERHERVGDADLLELAPGDLELVGLGHVGHRAAGGEVGQDHLLVRRGEDVGALGHEVDAAEDDELGVGVLRRSGVTASTSRRCSRRSGSPRRAGSDGRG